MLHDKKSDGVLLQAGKQYNDLSHVRAAKKLNGDLRPYRCHSTLEVQFPLCPVCHSLMLGVKSLLEIK